MGSTSRMALMRVLEGCWWLHNEGLWERRGGLWDLVEEQVGTKGHQVQHT